MIGRLAAAFLRPRFQLVVVGWMAVLCLILFFPDPKGFGIDWYVYRNALDRMVAGEPAYLVADPDATAISNSPIYFFPPPTAAVATAPFTRLPPDLGIWLYAAYHALLAGLAIAMIRPLVGTVPRFAALSARTRAFLAIGAVAVFMPVVATIFYSNVQGEILLLFGLFSRYLVAGRNARAGVALGLSILLKPMPALLLAPLLVAGRWRAALVAVAVAAAGAAASLPVVGLQPWLDFLHALTSASGLVGTQGYNMAPVPSLLPFVPDLVWVGVAAAAVAAAGRLDTRAMLITTTALMLLLWPVQWLAYGSTTLVAIALRLRDARSHGLLALAYIATSIYWWFGWLIAGAALLLVGAHPTLAGRIQEGVRRRLQAGARAR